MTSPLILFNRSSADRLAGLPPLSVTGALPGYSFDVAYTGRLQINNAVGDCTVEILPDSQLPDGYSVWVDNATHEVVVQFPAYTPAPVYVPVQNGGMEEGPAGVSCGAGWKVGQYPGLGTITGLWSAAYTGAGQASITWPRERVKKGDTITASIDIRQGASDAGAVGGSVVLYFYDMYGSLIGDFPGNGVWSGSGSSTAASNVTASAPADGYACVGASATRKRQNKPLYVDNARWNLVTTAGIAGDVDIFLHVRVRDSAGRTADWSGWIAEKFVYYTSNLYGVIGSEALSVVGSIQAFSLRESPRADSGESLGVFPSVTLFSLASTTKTYTDSEPLGITPSIITFTLRPAIAYALSESVGITPSAQLFTLKPNPSGSTDPEAISITPSVQVFKLQ